MGRVKVRNSVRHRVVLVTALFARALMGDSVSVSEHVRASERCEDEREGQGGACDVRAGGGQLCVLGYCRGYVSHAPAASEPYGLVSWGCCVTAIPQGLQHFRFSLYVDKHSHTHRLRHSRLRART